MNRVPFSLWLQLVGFLLALIGVLGGRIHRGFAEFLEDGHTPFEKLDDENAGIKLGPFMAFVVVCGAVCFGARLGGDALLTWAESSTEVVKLRLIAAFIGAALKLIATAALVVFIPGAWMLLSTSMTRVGRGDALAGFGFLVAFLGLAIEVWELVGTPPLD